MASFIRDIVQFPGEFEAKHADLIKELSVLDNTGSIFSIFITSAQHAYNVQASGSWATANNNGGDAIYMYPFDFLHIFFTRPTDVFADAHDERALT